MGGELQKYVSSSTGDFLITFYSILKFLIKQMVPGSGLTIPPLCSLELCFAKCQEFLPLKHMAILPMFLSLNI